MSTERKTPSDLAYELAVELWNFNQFLIEDNASHWTRPLNQDALERWDSVVQSLKRWHDSLLHLPDDLDDL